MPVSIDQLANPQPTASAPIQGPAGKGISIDSLAPTTSVNGAPKGSAMLSEPQKLAASVDDNWLVRSGKTWYNAEVGGVFHPIESAKGTGKALAAGAVSLAQAAVSGVSGLATSIVGKGFDKGKDAADEVAEKTKLISQHISGINLAAESDVEKTVSNFLGIIPDGIQAAGDTVFEKTGSALAGAGTQGLLTLLTLKPSIASRTMGLVAKPKSGLTPQAAAAKAKIEAGFDELAVRNPDAAQALAEHLGEADSRVGKKLSDRVAAMKSTDERVIGERSMSAKEAEGAAKAKVEYKKVGETPEGKPRVRVVTSDEASANLRDTVREGYETLDKPAEGEDITTNAFKLDPKALDKVPGVGIAKTKLAGYYEQVIRTINPESLGPEAKTAGAILARRMAEQMQKDSMYLHRSADRRAEWNAMKDQQMPFIEGFERGARFKDPKAQAAAEGYRKWNEAIYEKDQKLGHTYEAEDNYLYHLYDDSKGVSEYFENRFGPKWNDPKFIKDRGFKMYADAVEAGFKPKFTNPEDIMLARQHASDVAEMRIETLRDLQSAGLAKEITKADKSRPADYRSTEWRSPTGERYWVHNNASAVLHNAFNTKSLWTAQGPGGDLFRTSMFLKNAIVPIKLAVSLFHPLHIQTIDNATAMVRATKELLSGQKNPVSWAVDMGRAAAYRGFLENPKSGYRILKSYQGRVADAELTAADRQALQYMAEGGFIPEMSSQYRTGAVQKFTDAVQSHSLTAVWKAPFAAIEAMSKPVFQIWIPSLKIASYLKDVQTALKVDPSLISDPLKRQIAFRKLSKSVDNRYGEMAYSTLFWNRWVKDLAVANTLSLGWQLGFIREYGGGMLDIGQVAKAKGSVGAKAKAGMLDRPMFVMYYTTQALAYGGLMTWAMTGKGPEGLLDYVYPKTGEQNKDGTDARVNTMFYTREFASIYKHMQNEGVVSGLTDAVANKATPLMQMAYEWATGVNAFGQEIRDPNSPAYKQVEQTLSATLHDMEPMSVEGAGKSPSLKGKGLAVAGFTAAPKFATESTTEAAIRGTYDKYYAPKRTPFERAEQSNDRRELKAAYEAQDMDKYSEQLDKMRTKYDLSPGDTFKLTANVRKGSDPLISMFKQLDWQQQQKILDAMTDDEREKFLPHSNKAHLRRRYVNPADR